MTAKRHEAPGGGSLGPEGLWLACAQSPAFFIDQCCQVYDPLAGGWVPFRLWPSQRTVVDLLAANRLCVVLKARQLGISWLTVGYALWHMLCQPAAAVLFFSKRDDEAAHLLNFRLRGMYDRLPPPLKAAAVLRDNAHEFRLSNGSAALAFPTTGGRSYTASLAVVDEADHVGGAAGEDLDALLNAVKPTIDAGGRLILVSTVDKARPASAFKRIYRAAGKGENSFAPVFLPWRAHPGRSDAWYAEQMADIRARTGGLDDLYQEYPATEAEALAPRAVDKVIPAEWLARCYTPLVAGKVRAPVAAGPVIVHSRPKPGRWYVVAADPAEGNPQSDESAAVVLDVVTGEQIATLGERADPATFARHLDALAQWCNGAPVLVERNNHGHAVLLWLRERGRSELLRGLDGEPGWPTTGASKPLAFDEAVEQIRDGGLRLHDETTFYQLASIDGVTLKAPLGQRDDRAMACVLALAALKWCGLGPYLPAIVIPPAAV
jgi:hypothetical protein